MDHTLKAGMPSTPDDWIDVCIDSTADAGELLSLLDEPTVQGAWQDQRAIHLYWTKQSGRTITSCG